MGCWEKSCRELCLSFHKGLSAYHHTMTIPLSNGSWDISRAKNFTVLNTHRPTDKLHSFEVLWWDTNYFLELSNIKRFASLSLKQERYFRLSEGKGLSGDLRLHLLSLLIKYFICAHLRQSQTIWLSSIDFTNVLVSDVVLIAEFEFSRKCGCKYAWYPSTSHLPLFLINIRPQGQLNVFAGQQSYGRIFHEYDWEHKWHRIFTATFIKEHTGVKSGERNITHPYAIKVGILCPIKCKFTTGNLTEHDSVLLLFFIWEPFTCL